MIKDVRELFGVEYLDRSPTQLYIGDYYNLHIYPVNNIVPDKKVLEKDQKIRTDFICYHDYSKALYTFIKDIRKHEHVTTYKTKLCDLIIESRKKILICCDTFGVPRGYNPNYIFVSKETLKMLTLQKDIRKYLYYSFATKEHYLFSMKFIILPKRIIGNDIIIMDSSPIIFVKIRADSYVSIVSDPQAIQILRKM